MSLKRLSDQYSNVRSCFCIACTCWIALSAETGTFFLHFNGGRTSEWMSSFGPVCDIIRKLHRYILLWKLRLKVFCAYDWMSFAKPNAKWNTGLNLFLHVNDLVYFRCHCDKNDSSICDFERLNMACILCYPVHWKCGDSSESILCWDLTISLVLI